MTRALARVTPARELHRQAYAPKAQDIASLAMDLLDMGGVIMDTGRGPPARRLPGIAALHTRAARIAAGHGTRNLRNIMRQRVGFPGPLPQDVRVDRDLPLRPAPTSR